MILVRYGEVALKGKNRWYFQKKLRHNIRDCLKEGGIEGEVYSQGQRIFVEVEQTERALEGLRNVSGIVSLSPVHEVPRDIEAIEEEALRIARREGLGEDKSFRIDARRSDKSFPLTSPEINRRVGACIQEATQAEVDLSDEADLTIGVEVRARHALVYGETIPGLGGLPLTTEGRAVALMSGGMDSSVAAWLLMKRGCGVIPLHFRQSEEGEARFWESCEVLSRYAYGWEIRPIVLDHEEVFAETFEKLRRLGRERWACIFCKRIMLQRASEIADQHKAKAIVTGDSLGQVASQTMENLRAVSYGLDKPVFRPLIALDKAEIMALARRISAYEVSIRKVKPCPYLPPNPLTKVSLLKLKGIMEEMEALG